MGTDVTNLKHNQSPLRGVAYLFISVTFIGAKFIFFPSFPDPVYPILSKKTIIDFCLFYSI